MGNPAQIQSVFETAGQDYSPSDLTDFQEYYNVKVQSAVDKNSPDETCDVNEGNCDEGNLDIQYIMGMSQNTTSWYWYIPGADPFVDFVTEIADMQNPPTVNSISWGSTEQVLYNYYSVLVDPHVHT